MSVNRECPGQVVRTQNLIWVVAIRIRHEGHVFIFRISLNRVYLVVLIDYGEIIH